MIMTSSLCTHTGMHISVLYQRGGSNYFNSGQWTITTDLSIALLSEKGKWHGICGGNKPCDDKRADDTHQREAKWGNWSDFSAFQFWSPLCEPVEDRRPSDKAKAPTAIVRNDTAHYRRVIRLRSKNISMVICLTAWSIVREILIVVLWQGSEFVG